MFSAKFFSKIIVLLLTFFIITSCGIFRYTDTRKVPVKGSDRAEKNIQEGKGFRVFDSNRNRGGGVFDFATSNPMWRATIELLDFVPFSNVDYSGGIITTDWYSDNNSKESIKISIRFLSNEINASSLKIIVHQRICETNNICSTKLIKSKIEEDLQRSILSKAVILDKNKKN